MRIVFMGSAEFACPALEALWAGGRDEVVGLVTQPDRPQGRRLTLAPCPVKARFGARGVPVLTPEKVNEPAAVAALRDLRPDLIVVVAYGQIIGRALLALPPQGCVNVHGSLLPKYRGAAPIAWAIAHGESVTGITTMFMNARMDAGDILRQAPVAITPDDTGGSLQARLAAAGAGLLLQTLDDLRAGRAARVPQNEAEATLAPKLSKADGRIDWALAATAIVNRVRAFNPWPCCICGLPGPEARPLRVLRARTEPGQGLAPGTVLGDASAGPLVQAGTDAVRLIEVQPEGRRPMTGTAFLQGHPLRPGARLTI